jgi:hypothetical protein
MQFPRTLDDGHRSVNEWVYANRIVELARIVARSLVGVGAEP